LCCHWSVFYTGNIIFAVLPISGVDRATLLHTVLLGMAKKHGKLWQKWQKITAKK